MSTSLNIVFAGTPEFGLPCLDALAQSRHHIRAVYTQPDRPAGRGRKLQASAVKIWAKEQNIPVFQPLNFKNDEDVSRLAQLQPDVLIVIAYGLILPKKVLDIPKLGCINVHASLLPRWRGAAPIQRAILEGDPSTGVSIMQMDVGMDTGAVYKQASCPITPEDTSASLHQKLAQLAVSPLLSTLDEIIQGTAQAVSQQHELALHAGKISKEDAPIQWHQSAQAISRAIHAFYPWPIATTLFNGELLRIHKASATEIECSQAPGSIIRIDKQGIGLATGNNMLLIESIQSPGGKVLSSTQWIQSRKNQIQIGSVFE